MRYLRCNEHTSRSNQLKFGPLNGHVTKKSINIIDGQEQGFGVKFVFFSYFNQPIDQYGAHCKRNVRLFCHIIPFWHVIDLKNEKKILII